VQGTLQGWGIAEALCEADHNAATTPHLVVFDTETERAAIVAESRQRSRTTTSGPALDQPPAVYVSTPFNFFYNFICECDGATLSSRDQIHDARRRSGVSHFAASSEPARRAASSP
jgi:hypothetical protein